MKETSPSMNSVPAWITASHTHVFDLVFVSSKTSNKSRQRSIPFANGPTRIVIPERKTEEGTAASPSLTLLVFFPVRLGRPVTTEAPTP